MNFFQFLKNLKKVFENCLKTKYSSAERHGVASTLMDVYLHRPNTVYFWFIFFLRFEAINHYPS